MRTGCFNNLTPIRRTGSNTRDKRKRGNISPIEKIISGSAAIQQPTGLNVWD